MQRLKKQKDLMQQRASIQTSGKRITQYTNVIRRADVSCCHYLFAVMHGTLFSNRGNLFLLFSPLLADFERQIKTLKAVVSKDHDSSVAFMVAKV
jgi:hypothetical protein